MRARNLPIPPKQVSGDGPSEYFFRATDFHKKKRDPEPELLHGHPEFFERCVRFSEAQHPYLSYFLSYRDEPHPPSQELRRSIHADYLRLLGGGLATRFLCTLAVDHGDHEHGALLRHLATPAWPRFQPFYHLADRKCFSTFQLLVNRRYGLAAPENPQNEQLLTLAGKHYDEESVVKLARLRKLLHGQWLSNKVRTHKSFIQMLIREGYRPSFVPHLDAAVDEPGRGWVKAVSKEGTILLLKGPVCVPGYERAAHERLQEQRREAYHAFMANPYPLWEHFIEAVRRRRKNNEKRFPEFMDDAREQDFFGFEALNPDNNFISGTHSGGFAV